MTNYHPALPSSEQAVNNYDDVFSDHVPVMAQVPTNFTNKPLNIISWNVLESDAAHGMSAFKSPGARYGETVEQTDARHQRIASALRKMVGQQPVSFVALQEIMADGELFRKIAAELGDEWACYESDGKKVDQGACVVFYKKAEFAPVDQADCSIWKGAGMSSLFQANGSDWHVQPNNVHAEYSRYSKAHEANIQRLLDVDRPAPDRNLPIVIGDFNACMLSEDRRPQNIATSATPANFTGTEKQGACAVDGCLYGYDVQRAAIKHMNPETGLAFDPQALSVETLAPEQREELSRWWCAVSTPQEYEAAQIDLSRFPEYQRLLQKAFDDQIHFQVSIAGNALNERGIALTIDNSFASALQDWAQVKRFADNPFVLDHVDHNARPLHIVYVAECHYKTFTQFIDDALLLKAFKTIYSALQEAQKGPKTNWLKTLEGQSFTEQLRLVREHSQKNGSRTQRAYELARSHRWNATPDNTELFKAIYQTAFEKSRGAKRSNLIEGPSIFRSKTLAKKLVSDNRELNMNDSYAQRVTAAFKSGK